MTAEPAAEHLCLCGCGGVARARYLRGHNPPNTAPGTAASSFNRQSTKHSYTKTTPVLVQHIRAWLRVRYGMEVQLVVERVGDRNRVALRLTEPSCIYEAEVNRLNALRKVSPYASMERVLLLFEAV